MSKVISIIMGSRSDLDTVKETINLLKAIKNRKEFLVAPGCDLAPQTPLENIQAFIRVAKEYHK